MPDKIWKIDGNGIRTISEKVKKMTNKEQIQRDIAVAFDFIEQIIENPDLTEKIPDGSVISFIDNQNKKIEKQAARLPSTKYVKVKRHFELL
jgi:hypothetical protein